MNAVFVIAGRILRQRVRDRSAIVFAILTPLGLATAFAMIIPDFSPRVHTVLAVVDEDGGELATILTDEVLGYLVEADIASIEPVADVATARERVDSGDAGAAILIPAGFTADVQTGNATEVTVLAGSGATPREIARASVTRFANDVGATQLTLHTIGDTGGQVDQEVLARVMDAMHEPSPIAVTDSLAAQAQASLATFYGAAMAIMFVFFATQYGALAVLAEREAGTLNRLLASPIPQAAIIAGGALAGMVLGLLAMTVMVIATTFLVGASWGPPLLVAALLVAAVTAAMGISAVVATIARTSEQAGSLNAIVALCMAAVGGVFIPASQSPEVMARVALITPHAWFLRAVDEMTLPSVTLADIAPALGVMVLMGLVTGSVGLLRARRTLVPA
ncbi:MAG TPA: ABC transporter permease [Candidatus Limnocylindria bacterium]